MNSGHTLIRTPRSNARAGAVPSLRVGTRGTGLAQPTRRMPGPAVRIAAVVDLHCRKTSSGTLGALLASANDTADVLLLCGDLVDHGLEEEVRVLAKELAVVRIPMVGVLGNHDYESGAEELVARALTD